MKTETSTNFTGVTPSLKSYLLALNVFASFTTCWLWMSLLSDISLFRKSYIWTLVACSPSLRRLCPLFWWKRKALLPGCQTQNWTQKTKNSRASNGSLLHYWGEHPPANRQVPRLNTFQTAPPTLSTQVKLLGEPTSLDSMSNITAMRFAKGTQASSSFHITHAAMACSVKGESSLGLGSHGAPTSVATGKVAGGFPHFSLTGYTNPSGAFYWASCFTKAGKNSSPSSPLVQGRARNTVITTLAAGSWCWALTWSSLLRKAFCLTYLKCSSCISIIHVNISSNCMSSDAI